jgi:hypothetical protein
MRSKVLAKAFDELWASNYPRAAPLGYLVRQLYPERWFRIHSLPDSKRYPETEAELQLLLERQFTLIHDVFGDLTDAVLVSGYYTIGAEPELEQFLQGDDLLRQLKFSALASVKVEDDSAYWPLVATPKLTPSFIEALLRAIA